MHNGLHPRSNVQRLCISRSEGGRGLASVEDTIHLPVAGLGLKRYIEQNDEKLISAARGLYELRSESEQQYRDRVKSARKQDLRDKALHGQFFRQAEDLPNENNWLWLKNGALKRETEALIMACQEQAIRTNVVKTRIDKSQLNSKCRMCGQANETINHILNECSKLAQSEYKRRHDWIGRRIHWEVCRQYNVIVPDKWCEHLPERVIENEQVKVLWDFNIQTDRVIEARRPDLVIIDKEKEQVHIVDFAVPFN